jgi:hypothetical protein
VGGQHMAGDERRNQVRMACVGRVKNTYECYRSHDDLDPVHVKRIGCSQEVHVM